MQYSPLSSGLVEFRACDLDPLRGHTQKCAFAHRAANNVLFIKSRYVCIERIVRKRVKHRPDAPSYANCTRACLVASPAPWPAPSRVARLVGCRGHGQSAGLNHPDFSSGSVTPRCVRTSGFQDVGWTSISWSVRSLRQMSSSSSNE